LKINRCLVSVTLAVCISGCGGGSSGGSPPPPASMSLTTSSGVVTAGKPITLYWSSSAQSCTASGDWSGAKPSNGSFPVTLSRNAVFTLNCADASATIRVQVIGTTSTTTSSLAYSSTGLTTLNYVILPIDGRGQVYDAVTGLIHSITSATSSSYPQSVVSIDPTSGQVVASSPLSSVPWALTVSPDGQYLYVLSSVKGSPIQRFKVAGLAPDLSIPIDSTEYAQGLSVSPASPTTFAITFEGATQSQLQIFDGATPRPNSYLAPQLANLLSPVWTGDAAHLVVPGDGISTFAVDSQGVSLTNTIPVSATYDGRLYGSVFYDGNGSVVDLNGPVALLGQIPDDSGSRAENLSINKTFALDHDQFDNVYLSSFDATQFSSIDSIQVPLSNGGSGPSGGNLVTWGSDGVAWNEGGSLVIAHGSFAQQGGSLATPQALPTIAAGNFVENAADSYVIYDAHANDIAADKCGNLYAGISDSALFFGNSVLSLNAMSGSIGVSNYATSNPAVIQVAADCTALYVGSGASNSIVRLSTPALTPVATIPLVQSPVPAGYLSAPVAFVTSLSVAPNDANTIAVAMNFHTGLCDSSDYGLAVFDGGTRRPNVFTGNLAPKSVVWGRDASTLYEEDWEGIKALSVDSTGPGQPTLLVPYASLEGDTDVYDLHNNLQFDPAKSRILTGEGMVYDLASAMAEPRLPVKPALDGNGCGLLDAITSDQQTGKVFYAEFNTGTDAIVLHSFDSQTLNQVDQVTVPLPAGVSSLGGATRLVRIANANGVAFVTTYGYIVAVQGPTFAP
jgi:hypothetical protein